MTTITRSFFRPATSADGEAFDVTVELPSGHHVEFNIYGPSMWLGGELRPARVNWPSLGSSSVEDARAFAEALQEASLLASTCSGPTAPKPEDDHGPGCDGPLNCTCQVPA